MRWDLQVVYIPGKNLGGTDALSRYGVHNNNDKTVNWISLVISNLADKDSIAPWSEESICTISSSQPPISQEEIISVTATDKTLTGLISYIEQGFLGTRAELPRTCRIRRVKDMLTVYEGLV